MRSRAAGSHSGSPGAVLSWATLLVLLQVLTKSLLPLPDKWHGLADVEQRYRKRCARAGGWTSAVWAVCAEKPGLASWTQLASTVIML